MTETEWLISDDVPAMLATLRQIYSDSPVWLERQLHRYFLACCRRIWKLIPHEESRRGVEVAELFLAGLATDADVQDAQWYVEGIAFLLDYNSDPAEVEHLVEKAGEIPEAERRSMLHPPDSLADLSLREVLKRAAYFAHYAVNYHHLLPRGNPPSNYVPFLSPTLLRETFGNPFGAGDEPAIIELGN